MLSAVSYSNSGDYALFIFAVIIALVVLLPITKNGILFNFLGKYSEKYDQNTPSSVSVQVGDCATIYFETGFSGLYGLQNNVGKCSKVYTPNQLEKLQNGLHNSLLPISPNISILKTNYNPDDSDLILSIEVKVNEVNGALIWVDELKRICCDNGILPVIQRHQK